MMKLLTPAKDASTAELFMRLTLIDLLMRPMGPWFIRPIILILSGLGLASSPILRTPLTWLALFSLSATRIILDWPRPDNHKYLLAYWCLSIGLALFTSETRKSVALASRWLLGLAFALATIWKGFLSPDYLDGRFFRVAFIQDSRFQDAVILFTGITLEQLQENRVYLQPLNEGETWFDPPIFHQTPRFRLMVLLSTYGTLFTEAIIALLFLIPHQHKLLQFLRHASLLIFCAVTYAMAPVPGFGWLLLVMGLSQCRPDQRFLRYVYVAAYFIVLLYAEVPWAQLLLEATDTEY